MSPVSTEALTGESNELAITDVGADGTAAIAWPREDGRSLGLRVRPPGRPWGARLVRRANGFIGDRAIGVRADGVVVLVFTSEGSVFETSSFRGGSLTPAVRIGSYRGDDADVALATSDVGQDRVVVAVKVGDARERVMESRRTAAGTWTPPHALGTWREVGPASVGSLAVSPDGAAVLAIGRGRDVVAWRSGPDTDFAAPVVVGRRTRGGTTTGSPACRGGNVIVACASEESDEIGAIRQRSWGALAMPEWWPPRRRPTAHSASRTCFRRLAPPTWGGTC